MNGIVLAMLLSVTAAMAVDVVNVNLDDQKHNQQGEAGTAVTGSYSFVDADGVTHTTTYIADERGYRVIGRSSSGGSAGTTAVRSPAPKPVPAPAPVPKPVPVPVADPAPGPAPVPVPAPQPVVVAPAPAPVQVAQTPVLVPAADPAPKVQDTNAGLVYYIVSGGNYPFGAQFGTQFATPVAAPVAAPASTSALKTAEIKTSAVQSPIYYIVSGAPAGAQQISGIPFSLPTSVANKS